jgi:PAS domain S-box-containing protein
MAQSSILIVDDTPSDLSLLADILTKQEYRVWTATNGQTALEIIQAEPPDLVLLGIIIPKMDGYDVCRQLKADEKTRDIPVIFITALTDMEDTFKGFEVGGVDYIIKPFQSREVLVRVKTHLAIRKLHWQLQEQNALLAQQEEQFHKLADATFEGVIIHDQGQIIEVNQEAVIMFGYRWDELVGQNVEELLFPSMRETASTWIETDTKMPYTAEGQRKDGTRFLVEIQTKSIPWQEHKVRVIFMRNISWRNVLEQENHTLQVTLADHDRFGEMVGGSRVMQQVYKCLAKAAVSQENVILYGETGTGKELAARTIFQLSDHHTREFVSVNCGAIQETLFESQFFGYRKGAFTGADRDSPGYFDQAQGGTLFLDEVGELTLSMQTKLLRVLNDNTYTPVGTTISRTADMRIIAATNRELRQLIRVGKIREDFFHRIHVIALEIPPLRQHKEDIPLLVNHFLKQYTSPGTPFPIIPAEIFKQLYAYGWPGNVRELYNELRRYLATGEMELAGHPPSDTIEIDEVPFLQDGLALSEAINAFEEFYITRVLQQHQGQKSQAAKALGVDRKTLYNKLRKYGR